MGFYTPGGKWFSESDHPVDDPDAARKRVSYLNGGQNYELLNIRSLEHIAERLDNLLESEDGKFVKQFGG